MQLDLLLCPPHFAVLVQLGGVLDAAAVPVHAPIKPIVKVGSIPLSHMHAICATGGGALGFEEVVPVECPNWSEVYKVVPGSGVGVDGRKVK
jgi:hypothetical protein